MTEISRRGMATAVVGGAAALGAAALLRREGSRPGVTRGRGEPTSFGSVALLASSRLALAPARAVAHRHAVPDRPSPSAVHGAWTDAVLA
ncbi:MAG: hypothetical protein HOQ45_01750, partial [Nocardioidaceae bacterium]|nr:hypothetical protein [Nocardioidaceae bacterium]